MRKRWLLNLALAVLVLALALVALFARREQAPGTSEPVLALAAESITAISVSQPGRDEIRMQRDGDEWRLTAPVRARADRFRIDALLQLLSARSEGTVPAADPARFGLDKPIARVRFNEAEIAFGALHPFNDLQYVQHQDRIHLVPAAGFRAAAQPWQHYLSTAVLEPGWKPVQFSFARFSLNFRDGSWDLTPANQDISGDRINTFVDEWRFARAFSVGRHQGPAPKTKIRIGYAAGGQEGSMKVLEIGVVATHPEVVLYRADEGLDYHFPASTGERLLELKSE